MPNIKLQSKHFLKYPSYMLMPYHPKKMQLYQELTLKRHLLAENFPPKIGSENHILFGLTSKGQASSLLGHPENSSRYHSFDSTRSSREHPLRGEVMDTISVSVHTFPSKH